jgi:DNA-directed RNA polymerase subunit L
MTTFTDIKYDTPKRLSFTINNADLSVVNSVRRIILSEIPNAGFYFDASDIDHNDIKINKNTCALHNEFLGHRVSLVPLCFNENDLNDFDPSKYKFILKKQNNTFDIIDVTTKDFDIIDEQGNKYSESFKESVLPKNSITKDHILLTKLKPNLYDEVSPPRGEEIDMECFPTINTAVKHARWSPVSQCAYGNTIDPEFASRRFEEVLHSYENELGRKATRTEQELQQKRFNTLEVFRCFKQNQYEEANCFDFKLESECNLRPAYLFFKACKILVEKLANFSDNLKNKKEEIVKITKLSGVDHFYQIEIHHENYTLLNVLQCQIYNACFKERKASQNPLEYVGYYQPHPLDDVMILKLKLKDNENINNDFVSGLLVDFTNDIIQKVKDVLKEWLASTFDSIKDVREVVDYRHTL